MTVSRDAVVWAFRVVLGREPESEAGIAEHQRLADLDAVVETLLKSPEFREGPRLKSVVRPLSADDTPQAAPWPYDSRSALRVTLLGNCQIGGVARAMQALAGGITTRTFETTPGWLSRLKEGQIDLGPVLDASDLVLMQRGGDLRRWITEHHPAHRDKLRLFPAITYAGFHPDCVYVRGPSGSVQGPTGDYHSSIAFWAWREGLTVRQALTLFDPEVYRTLGFLDYHHSSREALLDAGRRADLPLQPLLDKWSREGCWMHSVNHPKIGPLVDLAAALLRREAIEPVDVPAEWVDDGLALWPVWPVYPGLAEAWGLRGSFSFKTDRGLCPPGQPVLTLDLAQWVETSFRRWAEHPAGSLSCERVDTPAYAGLRAHVRDTVPGWRGVMRQAARLWQRGGASAHGSSPYDGLPDVRFWRRAVERVASDQVDPMTEPPFRIGRGDKVATAGSCFAQHLSRTLQAQGFAVFTPEAAPPDMPAEVAHARQFGVYSARYGNVYTARQLVQLFDRAHGDFEPLDQAWRSASGRYVDPFRPQIEPDGHATRGEVERDRRAHLQVVRRMFAELDVFVFTLGLTEAWRRRQDGAVFPLAPGVVAGTPDADAYEFINFSTAEVAADLRGFLARLRRVNPAARVVLTVSPVPLIATYEDRHVLVSTIHSKSVLRAAAGELAAADPGVLYFPSYEIITGPQARGAYFASDLRSVTDDGVAHVMRVFLAHCTGEARAAPRPPVVGSAAPAAVPPVADSLARELRALNDLVCDEEAIDRHRR